jgi:hypothetical protein
LGFVRICLPVGESSSVRDAHFLQRVESGARGGVQGIGGKEGYYLLAQQSSLHHPTDAPIENRSARSEKLQPGECEKLGVSNKSRIDNPLEKTFVLGFIQAHAPFQIPHV